MTSATLCASSWSSDVRCLVPRKKKPLQVPVRMFTRWLRSTSSQPSTTTVHLLESVALRRGCSAVRRRMTVSSSSSPASTQHAVTKHAGCTCNIREACALLRTSDAAARRQLVVGGRQLQRVDELLKVR
eukprot:4251247-Pleurochrysis_carterae.AAC.1